MKLKKVIKSRLQAINFTSRKNDRW